MESYIFFKVFTYNGLMTKRIPPAENQALCLAPWTHTYLSPQGERRFCCASRESSVFHKQYIDLPGQEELQATFEPQSLEQHWNSERMKAIRTKMMSGQIPKECQVCHEQQLVLTPYKDYFNKTLFPHLLDEIYQHTDDEGTTTLKPRSFDYRFSNSCNFKCRMCSDNFSSAWEEEKREHGLLFPENDRWLLPEVKKEIARFNNEVASGEFEEAIEKGEVEEIYWVGGEPLIWARHWKTMESLIESGQAHKVFVRYNSNLSQVSWKGRHLFRDILPHFKGYTVAASIDGSGKIGEFIRTGLDWNLWLDNFKSGLPFVEERGLDSLVMDVTLTLPGLFSLVDLLKTANELKVKMYVKIVFAYDPSILLSPFALPRNILHPFLDDLMAECFPLINSSTNELFKTLQEMKRRPTFQEQYPNWEKGFIEGRDYLQKIAKIRGDGTEGRLSIEKIYSARRDVLDWWQSHPSSILEEKLTRKS